MGLNWGVSCFADLEMRLTWRFSVFADFDMGLLFEVYIGRCLIWTSRLGNQNLLGTYMWHLMMLNSVDSKP